MTYFSYCIFAFHLELVLISLEMYLNGLQLLIMYESKAEIFLVFSQKVISHQHWLD